MKIHFLIFLTLLSSVCHAERIGSLLWEAGMDRESVWSGKVLLFPGADLGGKAPDDAVLIGVIDSGVLSAHPQLTGYVKEVQDFTGEGKDDVLGHGTAVALIALFGMGVRNPRSAIVSAKVVNRDGRILESNVSKAIDWVVGRGVKLVNLSLGFKGTYQEYEGLCGKIAAHADVLFLAAAGNSGPDVRVFPAACEGSNIISVGATDESGKPAPYSGRGAVMGPGSVWFLKEWAYYYSQAQELASAGRLPEARRLYELSIHVEVNAESEFQIGLIDLAEKKVSAAIARFKRTIQIDPALAEAHEMLGASLFMQGDNRQAEKSIRKAIDLYPDSIQTNVVRARAHFNLGQTLMRLDREGEARAEFEEVKRLMPTYPRIDEVLKSISQ